MTQQLKINIPEGLEVDHFNKETGEIFFREKQPKYPTDISQIPLPAKSYYINTAWRIQLNDWTTLTSRAGSGIYNLERKSDAKALVALVQLITLRDEYNRIDGFTPNFTKALTPINWCICVRENKIAIENWGSTQFILAFYSKATAELFLSNFKELIEIAKPLL